MGIRFVLGRAGSGKSRFALESAGRELTRAPLGPPLILLVPEQMTQAADRELAARFGATIRAQTLSFRRLAFRVMQETGGAARVHIDDAGKKMILYKIAQRRADSFRVFRRLKEAGGWIDAALEWLDECKRYNVDAGRLREASDAGGIPPALRDKLHDLALLGEGLEEELAGKFIDSEDYLALLAEHAPSSGLLRGARVWVDGFHGFTPAELAALTAVCRHAEEVTICLTLDRPYSADEEPDELDLFYSTAATLTKLLRLAEAEGLPVGQPIVLSGGADGRHHGFLADLEAAFADWANGRPYKPASGAGDALSLVTAANPRAEAEAAARDILRFVSGGKGRWRDAAVFVRDWERYGDILAETFRAYGIPFFMDYKRPAAHHPLAELVRAAVDVVSGGWSYDAVFRAVKTELLFPPGMFGSETEQRFAMDQLEEAVLLLGIRGSRWTDDAPWRLPAATGLEDDEEEDGERRSEALTAREKRIDRLRRLVAAPLAAFERRLAKAATMREAAEALFALLAETGAADTLQLWRERAEREGDPERAREHDQVWNRVMEVLDQLVELAGSEPAEIGLFSGMLEAGLAGIRMGLVPPALDQVLVGSLDRTRVVGIKKLYMLGVNDGIVPMRPKEHGVVSEAERERLAAAGLELAPDGRRRLLEERFLFYNALFLPSEALWIGCALSDPEGTQIAPSEWFGVLARLAPDAKRTYMPAELAGGADEEETLERIATPARTLTELLPQLRRWRSGETVSGVWWAAYNWLAVRPYWRERLAALLPALGDRPPASHLPAELAAALYGNPPVSSVSRLERFAGCPFAHFAAYGLRLKERRLYRLEAPDIGQLYHAALSRLAKRLAAEGRSFADLAKDECVRLAELAVDELAPKLLSEILFSSNRHRYATRKLKAVVGRAAEALRRQDARSGFRQAAAELAFGEPGGLPPLSLPLSGGRRMELRGRIDRIDTAGDGTDVSYVRVVDYKSRAMKLKLSDVYYGLSLQLLAYLDAVAEASKSWLGFEAKPAGALYFHVHNPTLAFERAPSLASVEEERFKRFKMSGLLSSEPGAAHWMDTELEQGVSPVVPLERRKDGSLGARSRAVDADRWAKLRAFVRAKMAELGDGAAGGAVEVSPYRMKQETPCRFCKYKSVCGFDAATDEYRLLAPLTDDEAWERIERDLSGAGEDGGIVAAGSGEFAGKEEDE